MFHIRPNTRKKNSGAFDDDDTGSLRGAFSSLRAWLSARAAFCAWLPVRGFLFFLKRLWRRRKAAGAAGTSSGEEQLQWWRQCRP